MKKFEYRAEKLLRVYEIERDQERKKLSELQKEVNKMEKRIEENNAKIKLAYEALVDDKQSALDKQSIPVHISFLKQKNAEVEEQLKETLRFHQEKMRDLLEAQKKVKSLEKHKDQKKKEYRKEKKDWEEKYLNDLNSRKRK